MSKITKHHLDRAAIIYVRQSSVSQVEHNQESQRRQYALADRAKDLGWRDIRVIDDDLGRSGGGQVERQGFEKLLSDVCQGQVGGVFAVEASRLARNGHDWHRLLEFCRVVDTLIIDHDGVYDPKHPNDGLVLGLKGTMSEVELSMFRQRSQEAIRQMARRGEYYTRIAEGYVLGVDNVLEYDPDEQVRRTLSLVFVKFRELGSARQVYLWFRGEGIKLPKRIGKAGVEFVEATPWLIGRILKDPVYAGAYAFGRTNQKVILEEGRKRVIKERHAAPEDWQVLIQDHHEAYLSWSEYQSNLETLRHNRNQLGTTVRGAARDGKGLLAGLARCGVCGKKMRVRYGGRSGRWSAAVYYQCAASQHAAIGKQLCSQFGGFTVEQAVVEAVLAALAPVRIEALAQAWDQLEKVGSEQRRQLELEIERAMPVYGMAEDAVGLAFPPGGREPLIDVIDRETFTRSGRALPVPAETGNELRFVACGRPLPNHEIRVVDRAGHELPERREGRVQFRGPSACSGYYRNPEATTELFDGDWLNSGDLGYISAGEIFITGRSKDLIIIAGRNIYPQELEEAIAELEGIRKGNVAVFGSIDRNSGT
jgi:DNA invertase Pin-like site-specific DNA recombinase